MKKQEAILFGKKFGVQQDIVEKLLMKKTGLSKSQFFLSDELNLNKKDIEELAELLKKIAFGYPIEYALEKAEFYGLDFYVDKRCLIPRNDTEIMVDEAIKSILNSPDKGVGVYYIDVGTGSAAIPISVVDNVGHIIGKAFAVDISEDALEIAKINIKNHNLVDKIELLKSDLLENILPLLTREGTEGWVIITANLPYIKNEDFGNMDQEVILHEPSVALYGGAETGFELYEKLIEQIINSPLLDKGGDRGEFGIILFIEIGFDQKEYAVNYLKNKKLSFEIFKDNGGIERCVKIKF